MVIKKRLGELSISKINTMLKALLLFSLPLFGVEMIINNPHTTIFKESHPSYSITSKKYIQNFDKKPSLLFFNIEQYMLSNNFYQDGVFRVKQLEISFHKAYKFASKLYFFQVKGHYNDTTISAKKAIYYHNKLLLKNVTLTSPKKILRRKKYLLNIK